MVLLYPNPPHSASRRVRLFYLQKVHGMFKDFFAGRHVLTRAENKEGGPLTKKFYTVYLTSSSVWKVRLMRRLCQRLFGTRTTRRCQLNETNQYQMPLLRLPGIPSSGIGCLRTGNQRSGSKAIRLCQVPSLRRLRVCTPALPSSYGNTCRQGAAPQTDRNTYRLFRLWESGLMQKTEAYRWLQVQVGLPQEEAHIAKFSEFRCEEVIQLCRKFCAQNRTVM